MKILLVWPKIPSTFWSYKHSLSFISKRSLEPPLGLLTVAGLLPESWQKKLVDMNVSGLADADILWADFVFLSAMSVQRKSFLAVVARCNSLGVKVIAGGPMCTTDHTLPDGVDHFVLNEGEITLPLFLEDLAAGKPQREYRSKQFADIEQTPIPQWELLDMTKYANMDIQYSRGCPYNCEFCSITALLGHRPRVKNTDQFLRELDSLYELGWRGAVFIVDDNFIGNKRILKERLLPALVSWLRERNYPFTFHTETSIDLADDDELLKLMREASFNMVFVGIETPEDGSLAECGKVQNRGRDILGAVKRILHHGMTVTAGFIVGFDHDPPDIFERQIRFIQQSGISVAMVGLLSALPATRLFKRLESQNRIVGLESGNNTDGSLNFVPSMDPQRLLEGYRKIIKTIYSPREYFERTIRALTDYRLPPIPSPRLTWQDMRALWRAVLRLGVVDRGRRFFWKLVFYVLRDSPRKFPLAISLAIQGFHFRKVADMV